MDLVSVLPEHRASYTCQICGKTAHAVSYSGFRRMRMGVCGREECNEARLIELIEAERRADLFEKAIKSLSKHAEEKGAGLERAVLELELACEFYGGKK